MNPDPPQKNDSNPNQDELDELIENMDSNIEGLKGRLNVLEADFIAYISFFEETPEIIDDEQDEAS